MTTDQPNASVVLMLPPFDVLGNLPPGIHQATWAEFVQRFGSTRWRRWLLEGLLKAARDLFRAGCEVIYVDGSFVSSKENPGDYDACYELARIDLSELQKASPVFFDFDNSRAAQKAKYRGEWFPAEIHESSSRKKFIEFFQASKLDGKAKGIVAIDLRSLP